MLRLCSLADDLLIDELGLENRSYNALRRGGRHTIGDLRQGDDLGLACLRGFGARCMRDLRARVAALMDLQGPLPLAREIPSGSSARRETGGRARQDAAHTRA
ncbi:DNA-directed RNA polymerase subunit alpha C-terminal domain-containing protein [Nonomuraea sp. NPDC049646]|uniref:DNA-directed RNA polymerase subunit alpha C-terminal domain-containing protein n=1 Tax=unclassified Nonomuraea TaxID=2593643 RepID=UPI0037B1C6B8